MRQQVYTIYDSNTKVVSDRICNRIFVNNTFFSAGMELTTEILKAMALASKCEYFYVIKSTVDTEFNKFDFSFRPEVWDKDYVHIWNNDTVVRLFNTANVLNNPQKYTDTEMEKGNIRLKILTNKIYTPALFDIIFLSYDEEYADLNYSKLKARFPRAKRACKTTGILEAHKAAAKLANQSNSEMFYVVDADAEIVPTFDFTYHPWSTERQTVHVWHSCNPVNDLEYGYGGIKLFPTNLLLEYSGSPIDFTTSVSKHFKVIPEVSNITRFNTDPFSAWRSGFRECTKLASRLIHNQSNDESEFRLNTWCTKGSDKEFGDFVIQGALEGTEFGKLYANRPEIIRSINDYQWLEKRFSS